MSQLNLEPIKVQLTSANSRERLMALAALVEFPAADVLPLIKKVLYDEMLPVRSMAVFILKKKTNRGMLSDFSQAFRKRS